MRFLVLITLLTGCASAPQGAARNWVDLWNHAEGWRGKELAFQEMQRNDHIRFVEQGLKVVGIMKNAGSLPPTGYEREAVIFWTAVDALDDWQRDSRDLQARSRTLVGMRRLMELERMGWKVGDHVKWFVARVQEMDGVPMPRKYPSGKARWVFGYGGYGAYLLKESDRDLQAKHAYQKSGGFVGRMLATSCLVVMCSPLTIDRLSIRELNRHVALTIYNTTGDPIRIAGLKPMEGWKEPEHEE